MITGSELAGTEAKVFRAYWQDGLLDLVAGSTVVLIGFGWIAGLWISGIVVPPVALVAWPILRRRITEPRLGAVRFGPERRSRMRHGLVAVCSLGVVLAGFVFPRLVLDRSPSELLRWLAPGIPALILAALALSASEALRIARFALYGAAFVVAALGAAALDVDPGWPMAAGGALMIASGARLLVRFLRDFPVLPTEIES